MHYALCFFKMFSVRNSRFSRTVLTRLSGSLGHYLLALEELIRFLEGPRELQTSMSHHGQDSYRDYRKHVRHP